MLFSGNSASGANSNGGAIYAEHGLTASGAVTFTGNTALSPGGTGGAIYSYGGDVNLTDTQFSRNTATTAGGALYMAGGNLNYTLNNFVEIRPNSTPAMVGDNDFAGVAASTFNKNGTGQLNFETNNGQWLGNTNINSSQFFVGYFAGSTAQWGPSSGATGTITVGHINTGSSDPLPTSEGTLGGYGRIYANIVNFLSGSVWHLGLGTPSTTPLLLNVGAALTLPTKIRFLNFGLEGATIPAGTYTVATYGSLTGTVDWPSYSQLVFNPLGIRNMSFSSQSVDGSNQLILTVTAPAASVPLALSAASSPIHQDQLGSSKLLGSNPSISTPLVSGGPYNTIQNAVSNTTSPYSILLTGTAQSEIVSTTLSIPASLTLAGALGGTTISPGTAGTPSNPQSLFTSSAAGSMALYPSNLTVTGFSSTNQAGFINAANTDVSIFGYQVSIAGNSNAGNGGAVSVKSLLTSSGPMTFTGNRATGPGAVGGAIYSASGVTLTGVAFNSDTTSAGGSQFAGPGNTATTAGGAVYLASGNLAYSFYGYGMSQPKAIIVNPSNIAVPAVGDNDFACKDSSASFIKMGTGFFGAEVAPDLVLNTNNGQWLGNTNITSGKLIIGGTSSNSAAKWGPSSGAQGTINVGSVPYVNPNPYYRSEPLPATKGTLGGFGTIYANTLTFNPGSSWLLSAGNGTAGSLNVTGQLTLPTTLDTSAMSATTFPGSGFVTVATYGSLPTGSNITSLLAPLNALITKYNLKLSPVTNGIVLGPLNYNPTGLWSGVSGVQYAAVTFQAPVSVTKVGEGLLIKYGKPNTSWRGSGVNQPFFNTSESTPTNILLNNSNNTAITAANLASASTSSLASWAWTGSAALPVGLPYAWQLWKTTNYLGNTTTNWVAQGILDLTSAVAVTLTINPGQGDKYPITAS
ncbi:hypothetical protein EQU50_06025 [Candidatus Finniella inopinata]|uniref:Uncharacterized protein n=1 Tax=Candidatus Finniella inopinata TaxID=1696036 RepID=A0A4Q7DLN9_9PROT|nr:hypothetical protein EQU50_06025 [Candidatus Finniella inopinata]